MAGKEIKYSSIAREKMMQGVDTLADAVKVTLGDHLLAEGVVELPSEPDDKERADGEA